MGILKGKDIALEHIEKSKLAFLATLSEAEKGPSTHSMPPIDHFTLKFDRDSIRNLKGRVYENMKQYTYEQRGESIPVFVDDKETTEDRTGALLNPIKPELPTVGRRYVACVYDDLKVIDCLIDIDWSEVDELIKIANSRRKSIV
ncbi:unnamed protein product [Rotaria sordida]|uniref:Uncharacterized protein n=1 Tax=Rotaria sordida TaxID=392033 RepID=A0A819B242_9BILA|nr:unnamed protein product [Rotaria sordida]CAF1296967.1 unnamed protein product [Rotaria sordida]CAF1302531.1 unnamed protein product [Rotaria sordida]CAF1452860.1 unnamed protein product [Rotaria sordida]CAF1571374.1 unnamed protein product [Rotaria sordida]